MELGDGSISAESAASPPLGKGLDPFAKLCGGTRCFLELAAQHLANFLVFLVGHLAQVVLGLIEAEPGNAGLSARTMRGMPTAARSCCSSVMGQFLHATRFVASSSTVAWRPGRKLVVSGDDGLRKESQTARTPSYSVLPEREGERSTNHRLSGLLVRGRGSVQGCHASDVTKLPLVRQPVGQLAHFRLGQVHQQLCEIQLGIDLVPPASAG